jgi:hypothetical protein
MLIHRQYFNPIIHSERIYIDTGYVNSLRIVDEFKRIVGS